MVKELLTYSLYRNRYKGTWTLSVFKEITTVPYTKLWLKITLRLTWWMLCVYKCGCCKLLLTGCMPLRKVKSVTLLTWPDHDVCLTWPCAKYVFDAQCCDRWCRTVVTFCVHILFLLPILFYLQLITRFSPATFPFMSCSKTHT